MNSVYFRTILKFISLTFVLVMLLLPVSTFAAKILVGDDLVSNTEEFIQGHEVLIPLQFTTEGEVLNALEGKILIPKDLLKVIEIREGNSAINFWLEKPHVVAESLYDAIVFSGITPGGVTGTQQPLFFVVVRAERIGKGSIKGESFRALRNDGTGTNVKVTMSPMSFSIVSGTSTDKVPSIEDTQSPDDFVPLIVSDPNIFDGKYFVVFTSQDKASGIDHYEIREGLFGTFVPAESPYVLMNQKVHKKLYVKAIDKKGNSTVVVAAALHPTPWYQQYEILSILILVVLGVAFVIKKLWRKSTR